MTSFLAPHRWAPEIFFEFRKSAGGAIGSQMPLLDLRPFDLKAFTSVCMLGCFSRLGQRGRSGRGHLPADGLRGLYKHRCVDEHMRLPNASSKALLSLLFSQVLWIIPQKAVRWILVMIALGISGSVLAMTFWPAVREDNRRIALATIVTIVFLHTLLSVGCLVMVSFL